MVPMKGDYFDFNLIDELYVLTPSLLALVSL